MNLFKSNNSSKKYSIITISTGVVGATFLGLFLLFIAGNIHTLDLTRAKISEGIQDALRIYSLNIQGDISSIDNYIASKAYSAGSNLNTLEQNKQNIEFYRAVAREKTELQSMISTLSIADGFFVMPLSSEMFIYSAKDNNYRAQSAVNNILRKSISNESIKNLVSSKWSPFSIDGEYYLLRVLNTGQSYCGAWVKITSIIESITNDQELIEHSFFIYSDNRIFNSDSKEESQLIMDMDTRSQFQMSKMNDKDYLTITVDMEFLGKGSKIAVLVSDSNISNSLYRNYMAIFILSFCIVLIIVVCICLLYRYIKRPVVELENSINILRTGDFDVRIDETSRFKEFDEINSAFNDMVERIQTLKIDIYEEKLTQHRTEIKFLKTQIAPHFLINCLNLIYHLAESGQKDKVQQMTVSLGDHLRYALAERNFVTLGDELKMTENYIELSKLRFPGSIEYFVTTDESLMGALVLPLSIIVFVENTIKYEVIAGEVTEIHIEVKRCGDNHLGICIWDTGDGFSEKILSTFASGELFQSEDGHQIGFKNLHQRINLFYNGDGTIFICNRETGGAQIDLIFPIYFTPPNN